MAGLNDREALGIVVTASLLNALAQMRSISHALVSTLQKQKTVKNVKTYTIWHPALQAPSHGEISGAMPPQIFCAPQILLRPEKFVSNI